MSHLCECDTDLSCGCRFSHAHTVCATVTSSQPDARMSGHFGSVSVSQRTQAAIVGVHSPAPGVAACLAADTTYHSQGMKWSSKVYLSPIMISMFHFMCQCCSVVCANCSGIGAGLARSAYERSSWDTFVSPPWPTAVTEICHYPFLRACRNDNTHFVWINICCSNTRRWQRRLYCRQNQFKAWAAMLIFVREGWLGALFAVGKHPSKEAQHGLRWWEGSCKHVEATGNKSYLMYRYMKVERSMPQYHRCPRTFARGNLVWNAWPRHSTTTHCVSSRSNGRKHDDLLVR